MNERTLQKLEYHKVISLLLHEASTIVGRAKVENIIPSTEIDIVNHLQQETDEACQVLRLNMSIPFSKVVDITSSLKRSEIGSILNTTEIVQVVEVIYSSRKLKNFMEGLDEEIPLLKKLVESIIPLLPLEKEITSKIDEDGQVLDNASIKLKEIRHSIRRYEAGIRERLHHLTKTKSKMLSDTIITIRNNRYVLPVKHEYKGAIGGIVHDQSSSGQTLFMEPKAIIELNNQLQQAIMKEKQEIEVILQELTGEIANHTNILADNLEIIAKLDFIVARARLSGKMKASRPSLNTEGIIDLKAARHPLISLEQAVASDIKLGEEYHAIVITGPNTGGKTVTLKTIGLCILMAQTGLQIPALDGGKLPCFKKVFADIGDEQSIEQNLSTFSSHMTNIVNIMKEVDTNSLVLFDELGAGTDPQEGAALAMSILDKVIDINARVVATTHYPELKAYGYNRKGVMNASMEFDIESLRPTYRLLMGVPGRSNAFEISDKLGLQKEIIHHAKSYVGIDSKNVENMIMALEDSRKSAERELWKAQQFVEEAESIKSELEKKWEQFLADKEKLYEKAENKANKALEKAREEAELIVQEVRSMKDSSLFKEHEWIEAKKMLEDAKPDLVERNSPFKETKKEYKPQVGDEVKHQTLGQIGEIVEKKNDKEYIIQVGRMRLTAKKNDLVFVRKKQVEAQTETISHVLKTASTTDVKPELDLRGERYEDALNLLEKYIDDAIVRGYPRVTIIHGKGTGALRKGVEQFIKRTPQITSHRLGSQGEGGSGVTVVEIQ